jgi:DNA-binding response OmpR family regulator
MRPVATNTLLIIDDEPSIEALIRRAGEASGYEVVGTSDPDLFRKEVLSRHPRVICLDLGMPDFDGVEVLRFLAEQECRSRLLIISGLDAQMIETVLRLGEALGLDIAATISKPVSMSRLRQLLTELTTEPGDGGLAAA